MVPPGSTPIVPFIQLELPTDLRIEVLDDFSVKEILHNSAVWILGMLGHVNQKGKIIFPILYVY